MKIKITHFCILLFLIPLKNIAQDNLDLDYLIDEKFSNHNKNIIKCISSEYENFLQINNSSRKSSSEFENWLQIKKEERNQLSTNSIVTIPVVVHVIHAGEAIGTGPNISDAQVMSQIQVLNEDYRRLLGSNGYNSNPVGADLEIEFCLAQQTPDGNTTNGINRVNLGMTTTSPGQMNNVIKPATIWDPNRYLNIWVVPRLTTFVVIPILGYAQFPSASGLPGLNPDEGLAQTDGVVIWHKAFGTLQLNDGSFTLDPTYGYGRTATHEIGHWLGLRHIWGDGDCLVDDFCSDTPSAADANYDCINVDSCVDIPTDYPDMIENYMDYTNDLCMNIFTNDQKSRVTTVINNSPRRVELLTSNVCTPPILSSEDINQNFSFSIYPNPTENFINIQAILDAGEVEISIMDLSGRIISKVSNNHQGGVFTNKIDLNSLISGNYILQLKNNNKLSHKKIIKI